MFCPEIAGPDVMDVVTERSAWIVTTLCTTKLSNNTPQAGAPGLTWLQVYWSSWVYSQNSRMDLPAIPFNLAWICFTPPESPAHADKSCKYAALLLRGKCFG